ncbi:MAG: hypothetical protein CMA92_02975 [Euryarchaeota archaeon]|nr:hypothetical protein [Euryarchaeota archaeon]
MRKRRSSKVTDKISTIDKVKNNMNIEKAQVNTKIEDSNKSMWKVDDIGLNLNEKSPVEENNVEFKDALAKSIIDQSDLGIKENIESIKPENLENISAMIPRDRHLLVPINVQALVVPSMEKSVEKGRNKPSLNPSLKEIDKDSIKQKTFRTHPQRADLKTDFREGNINSESEEYWGIPEAFEYTSSNPQTTGLKTGIHLFWSLPNALLDGELKQTSQSILDNFEYQNPDDLVPEEFIPCDEGFSHPITFREAVENRVEFTTEDQPEGNLNDTLKFKQLPDLWLVIRIENKKNFKAWVVDSVTLEVSTLASFNPSTRNSKIEELTAIGPNQGDFYWTATYDNSKQRFGFHDLPGPEEDGPFDYMVCGWYTNKDHDPAFMDENTAEETWFDYIKNELKWGVKRQDVDDDPNIFFNIGHLVGGLSK